MHSFDAVAHALGLCMPSCPCEEGLQVLPCIMLSICIMNAARYPACMGDLHFTTLFLDSDFKNEETKSGLVNRQASSVSACRLSVCKVIKSIG